VLYNFRMVRTVVGVLRGGTSSEYPLSLKTGAAILAALPDEKYDARDIFIDKSGVWHMRGLPMVPARALAQIDVVLNALHGGIGEDGTVQRILERASVPYAGSRALPSAVSLHKGRARDVLYKAGIRLPQGIEFTLQSDLSSGDMARFVFENFGPPYVVKAPTEGSSRGILYAPTIIDLPHVIADVLDEYGAAIVEEFIIGHDATVGIIEDFRGEELYALPPAHLIAPVGAKMLQTHHHEESKISIAVPSNFSHPEKLSLMDAARSAHKAIGLSHYSRSDFRLTKRGPYLLEVNATPKLYEGAALPKMLDSVGVSIKDFVEHSLHLARRPVVV
jgi:D-alanine--D-alanine ligase